MKQRNNGGHGRKTMDGLITDRQTIIGVSTNATFCCFDSSSKTGPHSASRFTVSSRSLQGEG